ncbi:hypothetical protein GPN87_003089 [Salmonella enterica]|uniref:Phage tail protein n=1 Tax=Salmonella enterica subsp. enterica serovar Cardoner TaxID=2564309 RepID=A0A5W3RH55_SALET|nr:hypothetical protein [Salmonella enterica]EAA1041279.1 hypothetical protein [Salmonella enterica subsp. enterica serovar Westeinde]EBU8203454.1 hypothetical protein [Salmonella enterica subsp. enterica serovar Cardoner]EBV4427906.1 hypothetical protein [Salmonella enterica subsp. enterica serovar Nigeria]EBY8534526.1 hypothetical protein [Salmonella enterica subsp. enterica serovar Telelkebir]ECB1778558.1 hypothetical protein [Salmonella enterica subsp. enterica serovar Kibi]ECE5860695.1 h
MEDISGVGLRVTVVASKTFPAGFTITQFADDADAFDIPSMQLADKAMGLNGDLITWSKAAPLTPTINVIPGSDDDKNLQVLAEANRVAKGKRSALDVITLTVIYPDDSGATYSPGKITDSMAGKGVASSGRLKTNAYIFAFENRTTF